MHGGSQIKEKAARSGMKRSRVETVNGYLGLYFQSFRRLQRRKPRSTRSDL